MVGDVGAFVAVIVESDKRARVGAVGDGQSAIAHASMIPTENPA
jgi:hypothetical protein